MRSRRALGLAIGGVALIGLALLAAYELGRGQGIPHTPPDAVSGAVTQLLHSAINEDDHDAAITALAAFGLPAVPALSRALADPSDSVRAVAVETLGKLRGPTVVDALVVALSDTNPDIRLSAVEGLGAVPDRRAVQPLLDQFGKDDNPQVRYECLTSLGLIGDPTTVTFLVKGTSDADPFVRLWAMDALCQMDDPHARDLATKLVRDPHPAVRQQVIQACGDAFNTADGRRALIDLAIDADEFETTVWARRHLVEFMGHGTSAAPLAEQARVAALAALQGEHRVRAAMLLGDLGDATAVGPLIAAMNDANYLVRHHAAILLAKLRDRRAVPVLIAALNDKVEIVVASAFNSLQWFADDGDPRAQEAVRTHSGPKFTERLPR